MERYTQAAWQSLKAIVIVIKDVAIELALKDEQRFPDRQKVKGPK